MDRRRSDNRPKASEKTRREIVRRYEAGEKSAALGREFGLTRQAVELMAAKARELAASGGYGRDLSPDEQQRLLEVLRTSRPAAHGFGQFGPEGPRQWSWQRAHALAEKMFGRELKKLAIRDMFATWWPRMRSYLPPDPESMTTEIDESELEPEMLADKGFMDYIRSPVARRIREREIEMWRRERAKRLAHPPPPKKLGRPRKDSAHDAMWMDDDDDKDFDLEALLKNPPVLPRPPSQDHPPQPGQRVGKHKGTSGNPFTQKKKRRKKGRR